MFDREATKAEPLSALIVRDKVAAEFVVAEQNSISEFMEKLEALSAEYDYELYPVTTETPNGRGTRLQVKRRGNK